MSKRSAPSVPRSGSRPVQARPGLEALEDRQAPAPVQGASADGTPPPAASATDVRDALNQAPPGAVPTATFAPLPVVSAPAGAAAGGELVFTTPAALDPLLTQVGRFPEPAFDLPPSGGAGEPLPAAESTAALPSTPTAAPAEETAAVEDEVWYG